MQRTLFVLGIVMLASCASKPPVTEAEARFERLAEVRQKEERYPVLVPLPGEAAVVGRGIPGEQAGELRSAASEFEALRQRAAISDDPLSTDATVAELKALIAQLKSQQELGPAIDVGALDFPTPPPLD
ncbi:hypothetical protein [Parvularcula lutaonensis]|uniref:Lipoprotein n=1 Tax=Parvularcula lutaonensis TaxID=491923 RepID=A0ABV7MEP2_9PROT|nr:hypothetical protein [Parvularcula lutaonensis]